MYRVAAFGEWTGTMESCADFYSGGKDYCIGWEYSCPDREKCCDTMSLYNAEYARIKGLSTARWVREKRVIFYVLKALLDSVEGFDTGIDAYAWTAGKAGATAMVDPAFVSRVRRAKTNFHGYFPYERWKERPSTAVKCGALVSTRAAVPVDKNASSYKSALNDMLTKSQYQDTAEKVEKHANAVVDSVPGSHAWLGRDQHPDVATHLLTTVPVPPAKGAGLMVTARPWLDEFLRVFAPPDPKGSLTLRSPALTALRAPTRTVKPLTQKMNVSSAFMSESASVSGAGGGAPWLLIGAGAVVVLGAGAWLLVKKRK